MVGIVVVSHSRRLAEGVAELATQMTQGKVNLAIAAGIDDPENPIGTDAIAVMGAIEQVCDAQGVVVLMDLGSALLSTEMALELLDESIRDQVTLVAAPIVEGTMAASVAAAAGLPMATVVEEARQALSVKQAHLGESVATAAEAEAATPNAALANDAQTFEWHVKNPHGLHARPAAAIVGALADVDGDVWLQKGDQRVSARSLNSIAKLGVRCDDDITFVATGAQAANAVERFRQLAQTHFGEADAVAHGVTADVQPEASTTLDAPAVAGAVSGLSVNEGIVSAPAVLFTHSMPAVPERDARDAASEIEHVKRAIDTVAAHLDQQAKRPHGDIFAAHSMMLRDPELWQAVQARIQAGAIAERAWADALQALADDFRAADSQYMREREADVQDIARQVMMEMTGEPAAAVAIEQPSILLARDLMPSDVAGLDTAKVLGICLSEGGKTSHSAILARAMGIPALVKARGCLEQVTPGQMVTLDGFAGLLWFAPSAAVSAQLAAQRDAWQAEQHQAKQRALQHASTTDGISVSVLANIGGPDDVRKALDSGAEGVGLFRTEFLFQRSDSLPTEQEQFDVYCDIAAALGDQPLTIRSLDVGGDKPLAAFPMPSEDNPFLGVRGVRLCLKHPELLVTQLRAILRAHQQHRNIQLMIPMVARVDEVRHVKALLQREADALGLDASTLPVGIMIEVPAAVLNADALAAEVDFFSIGTNDLTQYVMAADRGNTELTDLINYFDPAVLRAIEMTCAAGGKAGIPVSMCGEMAGDPKATQQLLNIGLRKFSASASLLPALKAQIRQTAVMK